MPYPVCIPYTIYRIPCTVYRISYACGAYARAHARYNCSRSSVDTLDSLSLSLPLSRLKTIANSAGAIKISRIAMLSLFVDDSYVPLRNPSVTQRVYELRHPRLSVDIVAIPDATDPDMT